MVLALFDHRNATLIASSEAYLTFRLSGSVAESLLAGAETRLTAARRRAMICCVSAPSTVNQPKQVSQVFQTHIQHSSRHHLSKRALKRKAVKGKVHNSRSRATVSPGALVPVLAGLLGAAGPVDRDGGAGHGGAAGVGGVGETALAARRGEAVGVLSAAVAAARAARLLLEARVAFVGPALEVAAGAVGTHGREGARRQVGQHDAEGDLGKHVVGNKENADDEKNDVMLSVGETMATFN
ncbi:hypothetical protein PG989_006591 [Apiospora arundinis]